MQELDKSLIKNINIIYQSKTEHMLITEADYPTYKEFRSKFPCFEYLHKFTSETGDWAYFVTLFCGDEEISHNNFIKYKKDITNNDSKFFKNTKLIISTEKELPEWK